MANTVHYQWQNEFLLKTIYPLRELKLRDFIICYREIELWQQFKDKKPEDIPETLQAYLQAQRGLIEDVFRTKEACEVYFMKQGLNTLIEVDLPPQPRNIHTQINETIKAAHKNFNKFFPTYQNPVKEKIFISNRMIEFEKLHQQVELEITKKQRILDNPDSQFFNKDEFEQTLQKLRDTALVKLEEVIKELKVFQSVYENLDKYERLLNQRNTIRRKDLKLAEDRLPSVISKRRSLAKSLLKVTHQLTRIEQLPDKQKLSDYFITLLDINHLPKNLNKAGPQVLQRVINLHKNFNQYFPFYDNPVYERRFLGRMTDDFYEFFKTVDPAISPDSSPWMTAHQEYQLLLDLQWTYDHSSQTSDEARSLRDKNELERKSLEEQLERIKQEEGQLTTIILKIQEELQKTKQEQFFILIDPELISIKDIVRDEVEKFKLTLQSKNHTELLEIIVRRFVSQPECYPLWLQYMVIHFSGMRYRSAHGSWADPREILAALKSLEVEKEIQELDQGPGAIKNLSQLKFDKYQSILAGKDLSELLNVRKLGPNPTILTTNPQWKQRFENHLKNLNPVNTFNKRTALMNLRKDEEKLRVSTIIRDEVFDELKTVRNKVPGWVWKEIVAQTELRTSEVTTPDWEKLNALEISQRNSREMWKYRQIVDEWKAKHLTAWRKDHEREKRLIVTRAVCNEVAEHIQHVRGLAPSGGLTQKPNWFRNQEKLSEFEDKLERAYFKKIEKSTDLKVGASLMWLRWVNKQPHDDQITRPMVFGNGEELVPLLKDSIHEITTDGSAYFRSVTNANNRSNNQSSTHKKTQWLRWMHESMIAKIAETADGPVVFTFETSLPETDKGQSTIGIFKRSISELIYRVSPGQIAGTITGYVPSAEIPLDNLKEMLDWNKILQKKVFTQAQLDDYWKRVKPARETKNCETQEIGQSDDFIIRRPVL